MTEMAYSDPHAVSFTIHMSSILLSAPRCRRVRTFRPGRTRPQHGGPYAVIERPSHGRKSSGSFTQPYYGGSQKSRTGMGQGKIKVVDASTSPGANTVAATPYGSTTISSYFELGGSGTVERVFDVCASEAYSSEAAMWPLETNPFYAGRKATFKYEYPLRSNQDCAWPSLGEQIQIATNIRNVRDLRKGDSNIDGGREISQTHMDPHIVLSLS